MIAQIIKKQYDDGDGVVVSFFENNIAIGVACTTEYNGKPNAFLHSFKVKKQYRRIGYGTQILKYMIDNFNVEFLYVEKDSEAIKLYKRFGFEEVDMFNDNMIIMQRKEIEHDRT